MGLAKFGTLKDTLPYLLKLTYRIMPYLYTYELVMENLQF